MAEPVKISVSHVDFYYATNQALHDVSVQIRPQCVTALIGPSGCGKSTFLRSLNRMNELIPGARLEGSVELDGENIYADRMDVIHLRRRVGMIFQRSNPFPMSIYDNVAYGVRVNGLAKKRFQLDQTVEKTLTAAALWEEVKDRLHRSAMSLSGGQQQRLCIARALAVEPEVLLMDEPASALDPIATTRIEDLMHELKRDYTIVIVTHNMQQAARVADMTAFFSITQGEEGHRSGVLVEYDETKTIFTQPKEQRTEDYVTGRFG